MTTKSDVDVTAVETLLADLRTKTIAGHITLADLQWFLALTRDELDELMEADEEEADEPEQVPTILQLLPCSPLTVAATDGTETIPNAKSVFPGYLDSDFRNWDADEASGPTPELLVAVHEMVQDATFAQIFSSLGTDKEKLCLTHSQIIDFVKTHRQHLRIDGYASFFLFKSKGSFFVADVYFGDDGRLKVLVRRFANVYVWDGESRHRVVVPQL